MTNEQLVELLIDIDLEYWNNVNPMDVPVTRRNLKVAITKYRYVAEKIREVKELYDQWLEEGGWPEKFSLASRDYVAKRADGTDYSWNDCPWELPDETWTQEEINNAACIRDICNNNKAMEHIFLAMFGDHVQVVATRDGFDTSEFSHD